MKQHSNALKVVKPGPLTLIQDFGRFGGSHLGLTQGGPVDDYAYSWANHLLGNTVNSPTLEITLGQAEFEILTDCTLAITGANQQVTLDGETITNWSTFNANKGQRLKFGLTKNGLRTYLAIVSGFKAVDHFGSCATVVRDGVGGLNQDGQPINTGDVFQCSPHNQHKKPIQLTFRYTPNYDLPLKLRVIESYQSALFPTESLQKFYQQRFTVSQHSDRMGYRLSGEEITPPKTELLSEGIALGSIQVPPDGQPIVLLNDRQTIGGYPKIGCVARIDLPRLAQAKPGQDIQFVKGDLLGLQDAWCQWARFFGY
ncbi:biotin-dependent carboxyltransferase family protein [Vibrio genomosp. F10]|uniref:5-oxoprolinase subunit C family protein n=1 Tax=Vibrio genomosp. F10 TaxID=723171 RepID=UPI00030650A5|nr:biotin-dependent carboxyltransferase family protein [Vibrio genomosp. F10]OEF10631.1 allophanate hydrolase [Vibrio genomosp. F10 str. 9ZB36]